MGTCKTKTIQTDLDTFTGMIMHIQKSGILITLVYSEAPYIQNAGIFKYETYSEPCQTSAMKRFGTRTRGDRGP